MKLLPILALIATLAGCRANNGTELPDGGRKFGESQVPTNFIGTNIQMSSLGGGGNRMVTANNVGLMGAAALPVGHTTFYTATTTLTVPTGVSTYNAGGCGGGGGGASGKNGTTSTTVPTAGGGGGGGARWNTCMLTVAAGDSVTVTIGPGGAAVTANQAAGNPGTPTSACDTTSGYCCYFQAASGGDGAAGDSNANYPGAGGMPSTSQGVNNQFAYWGSDVPGAGGNGGNALNAFAAPATAAAFPLGGGSFATQGNDALMGQGLSVTQPSAGGAAGAQGTSAVTHAGGLGGGGGGGGGGLVTSNLSGGAGSAGGTGNDSGAGGAGVAGVSASANTCAGGGGGGGGGNGTSGGAHGNGSAGGSGYASLTYFQ